MPTGNLRLTETPQPTATPRPTATPSFDVNSLYGVCESNEGMGRNLSINEMKTPTRIPAALPGAATYDPTKPGPHPLVVFIKSQDVYEHPSPSQYPSRYDFLLSGSAFFHFPDEIQALDAVDKNFTAKGMEELQLIVCIARTSGYATVDYVHRKDCTYQDASGARTTRDLLVVGARIQIMKAKTGITINGPDPFASWNIERAGCPAQIGTNENPIYVYHDWKPIIKIIETLYTSAISDAPTPNP